MILRMTDGSPSPFDAAQAEQDRYTAVEAQIDAVAAMMRVARALIDTKRQVDLTGLEHDMGRLCASALDLSPQQGQRLRGRLEQLLDQLDILSAALAAARVPDG